jgi:hypothetical protein
MPKLRATSSPPASARSLITEHIEYAAVSDRLCSMSARMLLPRPEMRMTIGCRGGVLLKR